MPTHFMRLDKILFIHFNTLSFVKMCTKRQNIHFQINGLILCFVVIIDLIINPFLSLIDLIFSDTLPSLGASHSLPYFPENIFCLRTFRSLSSHASITSPLVLSTQHILYRPQSSMWMVMPFGSPQSWKGRNQVVMSNCSLFLSCGVQERQFTPTW